MAKNDTRSARLFLPQWPQPNRHPVAPAPPDAVSVRVVERAFRILETVAERPIGVSELARATALHKATVHRLLGAMMQLGYVEHAPDGSRCQVGLLLSRDPDAGD